MVWIEADDVDCRRVEHGDLDVARPLHTKCANLIQTGPQSQVDIQIMRHYPLVVRRQSASERHAARVLAIDLVRLLWPPRLFKNGVFINASPFERSFVFINAVVFMNAYKRVFVNAALNAGECTNL